MDIEAMNVVRKIPEKAVSDVQSGVTEDAPKLYVVEAKPQIPADQAAGSRERDVEEQGKQLFTAKDPTMGTIDSAVSEANSRLSKTRCEYSYDEATRRVSIKVFDKETEELIREVPPEKSLEMLQKVWELAGIMVDEKR